MKQTITVLFALVITVVSAAQDTAKLHSFSLEEYEKAKTFRIKDLDNDTYVKFENTYILDRYEARKPYFITGDDGLKKRVDLYRLLLREGKQELGTVIFYTNEKGTTYQACLPNFRAGAKVWEKYFEDIHAIDKQEANFVLKLSYVLSREFGFQLYKAANQGKDVSREAGTYGMDICFPGDEEVLMADGTRKKISEVQKGDRVVSIDPVTQRASTELVTGLAMHEAKNYAITRLVLLATTEREIAGARLIQLSAKELNATPNHPVMTGSGQKKMSEIKEGDEILCLDVNTGVYHRYKVWTKTEQAGGLQKVYNVETRSGSNFVVNEVMVLQK